MNPSESRAFRKVVSELDSLDVEEETDREEEALRSDETFRSLAVAYYELDVLLRLGDLGDSSVDHTRTFTASARSDLRSALLDRAQTVLGRPVPDEREETLSEPFEGVVVQDDPLVVDDGEESRGFVWLRGLDVELGDGVRVSSEGVEELSSERVEGLLGVDVEEELPEVEEERAESGSR